MDYSSTCGHPLKRNTEMYDYTKVSHNQTPATSRAYGAFATMLNFKIIPLMLVRCYSHRQLHLKAVVSLSGSAISFAGIVPWSDSETLPPAWTYKGQPIPYATPNNPVEIALECLRMSNTGEGNPLLKWYRHLASDPEIVKMATIPVERIQGPVLFISGQDDGDVPSFSKIGVNRLAEHNHPYEFIHLDYSGGTHAIGIPYVRVTISGRSAKAVAAASEDSWQNTKEFFMRSFQNNTQSARFRI